MYSHMYNICICICIAEIVSISVFVDTSLVLPFLGTVSTTLSTGGAENADMKLTDHYARHEIAGHAKAKQTRSSAIAG